MHPRISSLLNIKLPKVFGDKSGPMNQNLDTLSFLSCKQQLIAIAITLK